MKTQKLELIGMQKPVNGIGITMYFSNGEVKECWDGDYGFKYNNELENVIVNIHSYKDKQEWNSEKETHVITGKNKEEIAKCIIEGNRTNIDDYLYKIGIFNNSIEVNRDRIEDKLKSDLESTMSGLSSSISFLENTISQMNKEKD